MGGRAGRALSGRARVRAAAVRLVRRAARIGQRLGHHRLRGAGDATTTVPRAGTFGMHVHMHVHMRMHVCTRSRVGGKQRQPTESLVNIEDAYVRLVNPSTTRLVPGPEAE